MGAGFAIKAKADRSAEILIYEDVGAGWFGGVSAKQFADDLKALGNVDRIDVRINSYGGDVFDGYAIYQRLVQHDAKVTTYVDGVAASIASVIAMAGDEINIAEGGWIMIHDAWGMGVGNAASLRDLADRLDAVTAQLAKVYVDRSGQSMDQVRAWMAEEKWFDSASAIDARLATSMSENLRMAARVGAPERYGFRHAPESLARPALRAVPPPPATDPAGQALRAQHAMLMARRAHGRAKQESRGAG